MNENLKNEIMNNEKNKIHSSLTSPQSSYLISKEPIQNFNSSTPQQENTSVYTFNSQVPDFFVKVFYKFLFQILLVCR
jgi:hypothetical protein